MNKLNTYLLTILLYFYTVPVQSNVLDQFIDSAIASVSNTIVLSTHAAYQKIKLRNKVKTVIDTLRSNNQTYAECYQKKLVDKYHQTIRNLCNHLNINSKMFIDHMNNLREHDIHELSLPLAKYETAAVHSNKIPAQLMELIIKILRKFNLNPDRVKIDIDNEEYTAYVHLIDCTNRKRNYELCVNESCFDVPLSEIEGTIIHELTHILLGHLLFEMVLIEFTNKNIDDLVENDPKLIISNYVMNIMHAREYMADLYICVTNPLYVHKLKNRFRSLYLYSLDGLFQAYQTHPSAFARIKKLQKAALYLDYEYQSK
jgi:hypothetical protein